MKRLLVIGPSDIAAFKLAEAAIADARPDWRVEFFGLPCPSFNRLVLGEDGCFGVDPAMATGSPKHHEALRQSAMRINGRESVDIRGFDAVLHAGRRASFIAAKNLLLGHDVEGAPARGRQNLMTRACFDEMCAALAPLEAPDAPWRAPGMPLSIMMARPHPAEGCVASDLAMFQAARALAKRPEGVAPLYERYQSVVAEELARIGVGYFSQPRETYGDDLLTFARYSRGSRRLWDIDDAHDEADYEHMNAEFGLLCLERLIDQIEASPLFRKEAQSVEA